MVFTVLCLLLQISWREYFEEAFKVNDRPVLWDEKVVVYVPEYMQKLSQLVNDTLATDNGKMYVNSLLIGKIMSSFKPDAESVALMDFLFRG